MTSALDGGQWSASRSGRALPPENPATHWTGGWMGPTAGLETEARGTILCRVSNLDRQVV
jgi:hypothetical protein